MEGIATIEANIMITTTSMISIIVKPHRSVLSLGFFIIGADADGHCEPKNGYLPSSAFQFAITLPSGLEA